MEGKSFFSVATSQRCVSVCVYVGDIVSRKGTMTGGYHDSSKNRMHLHQRVCEQKQKLEEVRQEREDIRRQTEDILPSSVCNSVVFHVQ